MVAQWDKSGNGEGEKTSVIGFLPASVTKRNGLCLQAGHCVAAPEGRGMRKCFWTQAICFLKQNKGVSGKSNTSVREAG